MDVLKNTNWFFQESKGAASILQSYASFLGNCISVKRKYIYIQNVPIGTEIIPNGETSASLGGSGEGDEI